MDEFIKTTRMYDYRGGVERLEYEWPGGPKAWIQADSLGDDKSYWPIYEPGDIKELRPFRLKIIQFDWSRNAYEVARMDNPLWRLIYLWHRLTPILDLAYRRFIITLSVWRLADYSDQAIPHYSDIHIIKRIRSWRGVK